MSTEYTFDGLDEWEKNLAQIIDRQYPEEFKQMVIDIAEQALGKAKELTPVQTGRLRDAWNLGTIEKRGDTYYIEIYNTKAECDFDDTDNINEVTERALGVKLRCLGNAM